MKWVLCDHFMSTLILLDSWGWALNIVYYTLFLAGGGFSSDRNPGGEYSPPTPPRLGGEYFQNLRRFAPPHNGGEHNIFLEFAPPQLPPIVGGSTSKISWGKDLLRFLVKMALFLKRFPLSNA